jgi:predicted metal-dependent hydrolase
MKSKISTQKPTYIKYAFLKENNLTVKDIAEMFGYKNERSFRSSSSYRRMMESIERLIDYAKEVKEKQLQ